jgi:hypothetical protein
VDPQVDEIARMWRAQLRRPLPRDLPFRKPHGSELTLIDSSAAGCIDTFLKWPGRFARDKKRLKEGCYEDIHQRGSELAGDERDYFGQLLEIVSEILMWHARKTHGKKVT